MTRIPSRRARSAGFTLVEALVALVVMAFGMLALAGFQSSLSTASDTAKQRAEAVRLAQQKIEELRAFQQKDSDGKTVADVGNIFDYALDVVSGGPETLSKTSTDAYNTANPYTRQWWVTIADGATVAAATDAQKWLRVAVSWVDRTGQTQTVTLQSVISRAEPADLGTIAVGPGAQKSRTPKNRNVDIPYPAISLPGNKSAFTPPGSANAYVFDNLSGDVLGFCPTGVNISSGVDLDNSDGTVTSGCTVSKGYLLSGYVRFLAGNLPSGTEQNVDNALSNPTDATKELAAVVVFPSFMGTMVTPTITTTSAGTTAITTTSSSFDEAPAASCYAQRQKVVSTNTVAAADINTLSRDTSGLVTVTTAGNHQMETGQIVSINGTTDVSFLGVYTLTKLSNTSFSYSQAGISTAATESSSPGTATRLQQIVIAETDPTPTGYSTEASRFVAYVCVVTPSDDDDDEDASPAPSTPTLRRWWGQLVITPVLTPGDSAVWTLGTGAGDRKACRFTGDYVIDGAMSNTEHPLHYRAVTGALDNQNYLVIDGNKTCPSDSKVDPLNGDYINTHTLLHQTASGDATAGVLSNTDTQWATTPEPAAPTAITSTLPMF